MPLEITQREMNGIYLLVLKGRLVLGQESSGLLTMTDTISSHPAPHGLSLIWSKSIMLIARASAHSSKFIERQKPKAEAKLCSLGQNFRQALEIARLLPIFETCPTETAAVASF